MKNQREKCEEFACLHQQDGAFVIPNPWDAGSAKVLQGLGFKALATTSAGVALTHGRLDGKVTLEEKISHCRELAAVTEIPINVDFENGFADRPEEVARNVLRIAETGVAGCSIEDFSRDSLQLYDINLAAERVHAAAEAVASLGMPFQLTARAENLLRGVDDLDNTIERLQAYSAAGASVLFAPGLKTLEQLKRVTDAIDKPFNVLAVFFKNTAVQDFAAAGAKRISVGGALAWAAFGPLVQAGKEMLDEGTFSWTDGLSHVGEIKKMLL